VIMHADVPVSILDWDSEFWGCRIALVTSFSEESLPILDEWADSHEIDCLYLRLDPARTREVHLAEASGFRLMDMRLDLGRGLDRHSAANRGEIRSASIDDIPDLAQIARDAHTDSRFFADPHFPDAACRDFYAKWITNSVNGYADAVLVANVEGRVAGYVTGHFEKEIGRIGLIAVTKDHQGAGVGSSLSRAMLNVFSNAGLSSARVATQGSNQVALRFYGRQSFQVECVRLTFHRWRTDV